MYTLERERERERENDRHFREVQLQKERKRERNRMIERGNSRVQQGGFEKKTFKNFIRQPGFSS